ncbi:DUF6415 family natural product biosynthesis protein [Streptomyces sp. URMC 127]
MIRRALDRLSLASDVDSLLAALRWHTERLLPVVEAKNWSAYGQGDLATMLVGEVRRKLAASPTAGANAGARAVYCQELARTCRAILPLALNEPDDEQRLRELP